jgi:hypothetical protein
LDASAALWNEINYERRENYTDPDGDIWDTSDYREDYAGVLGAATVQQIERLNNETWRSFFAAKREDSALVPQATGAIARTAASFGRTSGTIRTPFSGASTLALNSLSGQS